jgi:hypothetical protein
MVYRSVLFPNIFGRLRGANAGKIASAPSRSGTDSPTERMNNFYKAMKSAPSHPKAFEIKERRQTPRQKSGAFLRKNLFLLWHNKSPAGTVFEQNILKDYPENSSDEFVSLYIPFRTKSNPE